jgi:hypothetical protein
MRQPVKLPVVDICWALAGLIVPDAVVFIDRLGKVPAIRMPLN